MSSSCIPTKKTQKNALFYEQTSMKSGIKALGLTNQPFDREKGGTAPRYASVCIETRSGTFSLQTPFTMSDILLSSTGSPRIFAVLPGKGGKLDASKSNFGV